MPAYRPIVVLSVVITFGPGKVVPHHYFAFIQKLAVLQYIPEQLRDELIRTATIKHYPKFNLLFQEGEKPDHLFIVLNGCVKYFFF